MAKSTKKLIKEMNNQNLIYIINKIRKEKENPSVYGKEGTSTFVTQSEFWRGHHQELKQELKKRKLKGLISKYAGVKRK